ncbi:MAG: DUF2723 domain-containing protein [Bacteroidales bacterium]|nr:DUF2723 domain-containing protein [Bacteroidales bacterium]
MKKYNLYNNLLGWISFLIAATVYLLTIEPSTSLWDCGEFIASAYKLEVGHPPGAPLFMILARFFSLLGGDAANAAKMVNVMSALASAATIMFLFWTITHLARKIVIKGEDDLNLSKLIAILGSGFVGAMAYTFSDTFWFSAVEGEVYASSSLFTALVFWAILKWENIAHEKYANRWLILIAYLMGLSIGVHLLNLLAIPAIVLVYYFKMYEVTRKGVIKALIVSVILLGAIMYGVISGVIKIASWFELLFVNSFGLPFSSGIIFYALALIAVCSWGVYITRKKGKVILNTIITGFIVIVLGYSSFSMIVIRSLADPPMDENNPETVFSLLAYLNREQYGDRPLLKGQYYNAPVTDYEEGKPVWTKKGKKYVITDYKTEVKYDKRFITIFPRMYSPSKEHIKVYNEWGKVKGTPITIRNQQGQNQVVKKPTFGENLRFFFSYQVGFMYLRYFMWNFAGRQNDIQSSGGILHGNWMSGIPLFDKGRIGPQENLPSKYKNQKSQNNYYMLPLLLGLIGMFYHFNKNNKDASVVLLLFILTGLAIVVYLNQTPLQPRERDYAYAGSFYAFAIWIGLGVLGVISAFKEKQRGVVLTTFIVLLCFALVPGIMAKENWDDHDRSGRYTARDFAYDYLMSCEPNSILLTNGDNDTFPLWYLQEVEEVRTDVRVVNLMLLNTDWYIDQMRRKAYDSDPVPFSLTEDQYIQGKRDVVYFVPRTEDYVDLKKAIEFVASDDPRTKQLPNYGEEISYFPTKNFILPVDSATVVNNGTVAPELADKIVPEIRFSLNRGHVVKGEFMLLDLLAHNNWERPVYFVAGGNSGALGLENYFQLEGLAYRLVPINTPSQGFPNYGRIDVDKMYDNFMNKFEWGRMNAPDVYLDHFHVRTISVTLLRNRFARLADALSQQAKYDSAVAVLDKAMDLMPDEKVPYDYHINSIVEAYFNAGALDKATELAKQYSALLDEELDYYFSLKPKFRATIDLEVRIALQSYQELVMILTQKGGAEMSGTIEQQFTKYYNLYSQSQQAMQ